MTRKSLVDCFSHVSGAHPMGQCWKDDAGRRWSPAGRLGWLWLCDPADSRTVGNFAAAVEVLKETNLAGNAWHESFEGLPDIGLLWLAHHRFNKPHGGLRQRIASLLHDPHAPIVMGEGRRGDGGWLDRSLTWLADTMDAASNPGRIEPAVASIVYAHLLRDNLASVEDAYHVWDKPQHGSWTSSQAQSFFERVVQDMERASLDPLPALNAYPLLSACQERFLPAASESMQDVAAAWIPRIVDQAFVDQAHPYRFPVPIVSQVLAWPQVRFPDCLATLCQLPDTMAHLEQAAPDLACKIRQNASSIPIVFDKSRSAELRVRV